MQEKFWKHFIARAVALIILPIMLYLFFFWVHFAVLVNSGPGDAFMSPQFQQTLRNNEMLMNSQGKAAIAAPYVLALTDPFCRDTLLRYCHDQA